MWIESKQLSPYFQQVSFCEEERVEEGRSSMCDVSQWLPLWVTRMGYPYGLPLRAGAASVGCQHRLPASGNGLKGAPSHRYLDHNMGWTIANSTETLSLIR